MLPLTHDGLATGDIAFGYQLLRTETLVSAKVWLVRISLAAVLLVFAIVRVLGSTDVRTTNDETAVAKGTSAEETVPPSSSAKADSVAESETEDRIRHQSFFFTNEELTEIAKVAERTGTDASGVVVDAWRRQREALAKLSGSEALESIVPIRTEKQMVAISIKESELQTILEESRRLDTSMSTLVRAAWALDQRTHSDSAAHNAPAHGLDK